LNKFGKQNLFTLHELLFTQALFVLSVLLIFLVFYVLDPLLSVSLNCQLFIVL